MGVLPRGTVTFLFTDVEGSTKLLRELGDGYAEVLARHRRSLRDAFARHGGVEVDTQGDAFFVAFERAADAVAAAASGQAALSGRVRVRMGVHTGEPLVTTEGYVGMDVHRAARIAAIGHGGQVLVSQATYDLVNHDAFRDLGFHRLKDLTAPERIYQLGDASFPPLRSLNYTNLPVASSPLVGREGELAELCDLLVNDGRLVTITGAGGSGKTRLALQAAAEVTDEFEDGVFFVPLAQVTDPALILPTIDQLVGAHGDVHSHLRDRRTLLLLDNLEQLPAASVSIAELLAQTYKLSILSTSRAPLRIAAERVLVLEPLPASPAAELFVERARRAGRSLVPDKAIDAICARVDRLPLAIELAAARTRLLDPASLLQRLDERLPLLTEGARDAPQRQQTLWATIDWSHNLLEKRAQEVFRSLAIFSGTFAIDAAEHICAATLDELAALAEQSLLKAVEQGRCLMLETIREYANERLMVSGEEDALARRHAEYFVELAESAADGLATHQEAWLGRLEDEIDNLRAALTWSFAHDEAVALRLFVALAQFFRLRLRSVEHWAWAERALEIVDNAPPELRARTLLSASWAAPSAELMLELTKAAAEGFRTLGDARGASEALRLVGFTLGYQGDVDGAVAAGDEAIRLARGLGDSDLIARALHNRGNVDALNENFDNAIRTWDEAAERFRGVGDTIGLANSLSSKAAAMIIAGQYDEAVTCIGESLALAGQSDLVRLTSVIIIDAACSLFCGDLERASERFLEALALFDDREPDRDSIAETLYGLGAVAAARGDVTRASRLEGFARAEFEVLGSVGWLFRELEPRFYERARAVDPDGWEKQRAVGAKLSAHEAVDFARGEARLDLSRRH